MAFFASAEDRPPEYVTPRDPSPVHLSKHLALIPSASDLQSHGQRFVAGTRQWVVNHIEAWRTNLGDPRCLLLLAGPGFGKTAIIARYVTALHDRQHVLALHLCFHNDAARRDPIRVVKSLAFQIAERVPEFERALKEEVLVGAALGALNKSIEEEDASEVVERLLIQPLANIPVPAGVAQTGGRLLLVVDALDEAEHNEKNDLLNCIVDDIARGLPKWCALLLTSQPDELLGEVLEDLQPTVMVAEWNEELCSADARVFLQGVLSPFISGGDDDEKGDQVEKGEKGENVEGCEAVGGGVVEMPS